MNPLGHILCNQLNSNLIVMMEYHERDKYLENIGLTGKKMRPNT